MKALWFITWKCQFCCPYCWEANLRKAGKLEDDPFIPVDTAVAMWNKIHPELLDITGGEPFVYPGFVDMLSRLDSSISLAMTTNLQSDLTDFVSKIPASRFRSITVSYHPSQRMSLDCFLGKALLLKNRGFPVTVNFVAYPEQMWIIPRLKKIFSEENDILVHVDPYSETDVAPFDMTEKEKDWLAQWIGKDRKIESGTRQVYCTAGMNRMVVFPDGEIYGCLKDRLEGRGSIGSLYRDFTPNTEKVFCANANVCAGCDRDHVEVENV